MTDYCTPAELKNWLQIDDSEDDPVLDTVCSSVSRWIDGHTGQFFFEADQTRTLVATNPHLLDLGAPLQSVTTLKTDAAGDGTFETTWDAADYQLLPFDATYQPTPEPYTQIRALRNNLFPVPSSLRSDRVQIVGTWGWPGIPDQVKQAALIQASRVFKRRGSPEGVAGFGEFGVVRVGNRLDPDVVAMLVDFTPPMVA